MASKKRDKTAPAPRDPKVLMACRSCYKTQHVDKSRVERAPVTCPDCMSPLVPEQQF